MKALVFALMGLSLSLPAAARCVVEIISSAGDPLAVFQENTCPPAMEKCRAQLARLNLRGATCEITLDIPGHGISAPDSP